MADYYAVLKRTLSGFGNANAQLRTKLYERARLTIRGQLAARSPALDEAAMAAEMQRLEEAIAKIEGENGGEVPVAALPPSAADAKSDPNPLADQVAKSEPAEKAEPSKKPKKDTGDSEAPKDVPVSEDSKVALPPSDKQPSKSDTEGSDGAAEEPKPAKAADAEKGKPRNETPEEGETKSAAVTPSVEDAAEPEVDGKPDDPIMEAISEFTEVEAARKAEQAVVLEEVADPTDIVEAKLLNDVSAAVDAASDDTAAPPLEPETVASEPPADIDPISDSEDLSIPPAMGGAQRRSTAQRVSRWISIILLVLAIGAALWAYQKPIMIALGLAEDPTRPKPVKTIAIKPAAEESEPVEAKDATPEPAVEPKDEEPVVPEPKSEERLTESGEEAQPAAPVEPIVPPESAEETTEPASTEQQTKDAPPSDVQTAILYEKNPIPPAKGLDAGNVKWSVAQEAPASDQPEEPAIRAEVEIPSRGTVMIMTIKRNADPALTASHLIELIFAVPDDFSGGTINTINRIVLKENEQDRGAPLAAVPVKISDGIFLIALDNLPEAKSANETLLKSRAWLDIPLQYRTGAQALITLEKGAAGQKVFDDVFAAWDAAAKQP